MAPGASAVLYHRDDAPWDGNQRADTPWVRTVFEPQPDDELTVSLPQFSLQATNVPQLFRAQAFNHGTKAPQWEAGPFGVVEAEADGTVVEVNPAFDEEELDLVVTARYSNQVYAACAVVAMVEPVLLDPPQISLNPFDEVPVEAEHLEYQEVAVMGGEPITHIAFQLPSMLYLELDGVEYDGYAIFPASQVPALRLRQRGFRALRDFVHLAIRFWVSFDRGAVVRGVLVDRGDRVPVLRPHRPGVRRDPRRPATLAADQVAGAGADRAVRARRAPDRQVGADHPPHDRADGGDPEARAPPKLPRSPVADHLEPPRQALAQQAVDPGGPAPDMYHAQRVRRVFKTGLQLCHLELDQYAFPLVNNVLCESHIKKGGRPNHPGGPAPRSCLSTSARWTSSGGGNARSALRCCTAAGAVGAGEGAAEAEAEGAGVVEGGAGGADGSRRGRAGSGCAGRPAASECKK